MGHLLDEWRTTDVVRYVQQKYNIATVAASFHEWVSNLNAKYVWNGYSSDFRIRNITTPTTGNMRIPGITNSVYAKGIDLFYTGSGGAITVGDVFGMHISSASYTQLDIMNYFPRLCPVLKNAREYVNENYATDSLFYRNPTVYKTNDISTCGFDVQTPISFNDMLAAIPENAYVIDHYELYTDKSDGTEQTIVSSYSLNGALVIEADVYIPVQWSNNNGIQSYCIGYLHSALSNSFADLAIVTNYAFRGAAIWSAFIGRNAQRLINGLHSAIVMSGESLNYPIRVCTNTYGKNQPGVDLANCKTRGSLIYGTKEQWTLFFDCSGLSWNFDVNIVKSASGDGLRQPITPGQPDNPTDDTPGAGDNFNDDVIYPDISYVPSTAIYSRYWLKHSEVQDLKNFLFTETFINDVRRLWTNPAEYIIGLDYYPFEYTALEMGAGQGSICVANINTGITTVSMLDTGTPFIYGGYVDIQPYFNSYMDYAPYTSIDIYIPYIGIRQLNVHQVMGHRLDIGYVFDFNSRQFTAMLGIDGDLILSDSELSHAGTLGRVLTQFTGIMCTQFPFGGTSANETALNVIQTSAGILTSAGAIGAGIAGANPAAIMGGATGLINTLTNTPDIITPNVYGNISPMSGIFAPQRPYLIINHPIPARPAAWQSLHGNPAGYSGIVSDFTGFLQCISIDIPAVSTMTAEEQTEIENLMQGGIFIE